MAPAGVTATTTESMPINSPTTTRALRSRTANAAPIPSPNSPTTSPKLTTPSPLTTTARSPDTASPEGTTAPDFFWTYTEEPHRTRRAAIVKAHPEVVKLCGPEPLTKWLVLAVVCLQCLAAYLLRDTPFFSWTFFLTAYLIGGTANQNLFLAIHEISHNLAFRKPQYNRALAVFANLPIGIPYSASFRPYHLTHHKSLGVHGLDTDIPTALEAVFFSSVLGKAFFCTFQLLFYAIRPMFVYKLPLGPLHFANIAAQVAFDWALVHFVGGKALGYLIFSSFLAGSLHPCAGHFIAEHYILSRHVRPKVQKSKEQAPLTSLETSVVDVTAVPKPEETYSYYGPLNIFTYNVGLHNEHHDFPFVPWTRLPKLHAIARDFYDELPHHESWVAVLWNFVFDPEVALWCRVKREGGGRLVGGAWDVGE